MSKHPRDTGAAEVRTAPEDISPVRAETSLRGDSTRRDCVAGDRGWLTPPRQFLRMCWRNRRRVKAADTTGAKVTGAGLLTRSLVVRRLLRRILAPDEMNVGLLLPPSVAGVVLNTAILLDRRRPVNLNYAVSSEVLGRSIAQAGIRHVVTSRKVMARLEQLRVDAEMVYLEDLPQKTRLWEKLAAAAQAWLAPPWLLERCLGLTQIRPDDVMTIIFTSGSSGDPKGVMLSYRNIGSNVEAFDEMLGLSDRDVLLGVLPLFHSFGYTVTFGAAMMLNPKVVYHYNPLEYHHVGALAREQGATILVGAPTFLRTYVRRCAKEDFATVNLVIAGAERMPIELMDAFEQKFGVRPVEGYGTTELSPVVSCNVPASRSITGAAQIKEGTIGRPMRDIEAKVVDLDTGEDLGPDRPGMLLIRGPNVMLGYLNQPEKTAEVVRDGWYRTGDVATIDREGYIRITGRLNRFAKIGGEMVPHLRVEEALVKVLGMEEEKTSLVVTSVGDAKKGERLVVLHTGMSKPPESVCRELRQVGLPTLWIPSHDAFHQVDQIPVLGTGKVDLKQVQEIAMRLTAR